MRFWHVGGAALPSSSDSRLFAEALVRQAARPAHRPNPATATRADRSPSALSHGEHRQIELAMALAGNTRMFLHDEPMAGLGPEESARMVRNAPALSAS